MPSPRASLGLLVKRTVACFENEGYIVRLLDPINREECVYLKYNGKDVYVYFEGEKFTGRVASFTVTYAGNGVQDCVLLATPIDSPVRLMDRVKRFLVNNPLSEIEHS